MADVVGQPETVGVSIPRLYDDIGGGAWAEVVSVSGAGGAALVVDTELPPAAAAGDDTANPTAPAVISFGMAFDGTTWDRVRGTSADGLLVNTEMPAAVALADSVANPTAPAVGAFSLLWNGTLWDRERGNVEGTVLTSAARTVTTNSADISNPNGRGVQVVIDVTAITDTPSVVFNIQVKDILSGQYVTLLASAAITAVGTTILEVYPGSAAVANLVASRVVGRTWRVNAVHGDADSITYSVFANIML